MLVSMTVMNETVTIWLTAQNALSVNTASFRGTLMNQIRKPLERFKHSLHQQSQLIFLGIKRIFLKLKSAKFVKRSQADSLR